VTSPADRTVEANGITIAYETCGSDRDVPVVLVMGLAMQMLAWHDDLCAALAARGLFVVRFDNRDVGLSTHLYGARTPSLFALLRRDYADAAYRLEDLADDTAGLLDGLGLDSAHVVGASMGGMIAQALAIRHPARVRSLTSIMSTTSPRVGQATLRARSRLIQPPARTRAAAAQRLVRTFRVIGSPGYALDEEWLRDLALRCYDRCHDPAGALRQLAAIGASGDRTAALRRLEVPALVIHGEADPLIRVAGGRATAAAIPGCTLITVPGMGHNLPQPLWPMIIDSIVALVTRTEAARSGT
jgi:pimeloyl-ACP methyl ester carboxylesterase